MNISVDKITIEFSNGEFVENCNMYEDNTEEEIKQWQEKFYDEIETAIGTVYPYTKIEIGESYNQLFRDKITVSVSESVSESDYNTEDGNFSLDYDDGYVLYQAEEDAEITVRTIIDETFNRGSFW